MAAKRSSAIINPNLGLHLSVSPIDVPPGALQSGLNFTINNGVITNYEIGWKRFSTNWRLPGPGVYIDNFQLRDLSEHLMFCTLTDVLVYEAATDTIKYLTPIYATGTASASGTAVTGSGTSWATNTKAGDFISFGSAAQNDPNATWYQIQSVNSNTSLTLAASAGTVASGAYTIRKTFIGTWLDLWDSTTFINDGASGDDLWFVTNGRDDIMTWNGTDATLTPHPELGFKCKTFEVYSNMMIYGNIIEGIDTLTSTIINSEPGFPLRAGSTGTSLSEQFVTYAGPDQIIRLKRLGDYLMIMTDRRIVLAQFIGDPLIFQFRVAINGYGPAGKNALADFGDYVEFMAADSMYRFDGVNLTKINGHVFYTVLKSVDSTRRFRIYARLIEETGTVMWSLPLTTDTASGSSDGQPELAYVEHYREQIPQGLPTPFSSRQFPFTAVGQFSRIEGSAWQDMTRTWADATVSWNSSSFGLAFPQNIAADKAGYVYIYNTGQDGNGSVLPSTIRFGRYALGSGRERFMLSRVYPFTQQSPGNSLDVNCYFYDSAAAQQISSLTVNFDLDMPQEDNFVSVFKRGRFYEVEFAQAGGEGFVLTGYDYDIKSGGMR